MTYPLYAVCWSSNFQEWVVAQFIDERWQDYTIQALFDTPSEAQEDADRRNAVQTLADPPRDP